jgi:hypothetical protein
MQLAELRCRLHLAVIHKSFDGVPKPRITQGHRNSEIHAGTQKQRDSHRDTETARFTQGHRNSEIHAGTQKQRDSHRDTETARFTQGHMNSKIHAGTQKQRDSHRDTETARFTQGHMNSGRRATRTLDTRHRASHQPPACTAAPRAQHRLCQRMTMGVLVDAGSRNGRACR